MTEPERIFVTLAVDFSDEILVELREIRRGCTSSATSPISRPTSSPGPKCSTPCVCIPSRNRRRSCAGSRMHTAGMNQALDYPIVQAEDIIATSTSGMHASNMAHYCLMMMLMCNYNMPGAFALQSRAEWPARPGAVFTPIDMERQTVGIVGYGSVGRELARLCATMGMTVLATKRDLSDTAERNEYALDGMGDPGGDIPDRIYPAETVASMAKDCDYLVVTVPQTAATEHLINQAVLDAMKSTAALINVSRGPIVDEKALITACLPAISPAPPGRLRRRTAAENQPPLEPRQRHHHAAYRRRHPRLP